MSDKVKLWMLFGLSAVVGALVVGWAVNRYHIEELQAEQIQRFIAAGPRFTAQDGQALCERIAALERESYGFRNSGRQSAPCTVYQERR